MFKVKYKDGTEEKIEGYDELDIEESDFVIFSGKDKEDLYISKDIIAKME